jgi:4-hydroxy-tetrahydrodipicolinate synthase
VADSIEEQADELTKMYESGTEALILITNRLDLNNEGDDVWIANAEKLLSLLPKDANLGLYECPLPYKRLVTPKILKWCLETGRFYYMKDTCCDIDIIKERLKIIKGTHFKLLNANCQTLLASLQAGGAGYCGIMANYHPELYAWLCANYEKEPEKAEALQCLLGTVGFTETGIPYPLTAKYHMCLEGIKTENIARNRKSEAIFHAPKQKPSSLLYKAFSVRGRRKSRML